MNITPKTKKYGIIIIAVLIVGFFAYSMFASKNTSPSPTKNTNTANSKRTMTEGGLSSSVTEQSVNPADNTATSSNTTIKIESTIGNLLSNVSTLSLSDDIFRSNAFKMLSDGTVTLPPRNDPGRRNPFSELSGSGTTTSINPNVTTITPPPEQKTNLDEVLNGEKANTPLPATL